jgi:predicted metal-dependent peptidase
LRSQVEKDKIESGGTAIGCVMADIKKSNPNLAIILTDGYYDSSAIMPTSEILWIISKRGNSNHPLSHIGKTILLDGLK